MADRANAGPSNSCLQGTVRTRSQSCCGSTSHTGFTLSRLSVDEKIHTLEILRGVHVYKGLGNLNSNKDLLAALAHRQRYRLARGASELPAHVPARCTLMVTLRLRAL